MTRLGIIGATNYIGQSAIGLLKSQGHEPVGFSRTPKPGDGLRTLATRSEGEADIPYWMDIGPIGSIDQRVLHMASYGARKILAISSTSRFTKISSVDPKEADLVKRLELGEDSFAETCERNGLGWVILRPTVIYGLGKDRNIREIAGMIRRFGFFPVFGKADGKRQPIHAEDLAQACISALLSDKASNKAYNVSGGEELPYREMVKRIFEAMGRRATMPTVPLTAFVAALAIIRRLPRFSHWTPQMAERMNVDMTFDHNDAAQDFGFSPRPFRVQPSDVI